MTLLDKYALRSGDICAAKKPGNNTIKKIMYVIERKGVQLDLRYSIHFFGPYSSRLDHVLHILENEGRLEIDTSRQTHRIIMEESTSEPLEGGEAALVDMVRKAFYDKSPM